MAKAEDVDPQELLKYIKQQYSTNPAFKSEFDTVTGSSSVPPSSSSHTSDLPYYLNIRQPKIKYPKFKKPKIKNIIW